MTCLFKDGHPLRLLAELEGRRDRKKIVRFVIVFSILARLEFARFHISLNRKKKNQSRLKVLSHLFKYTKNLIYTESVQQSEKNIEENVRTSQPCVHALKPQMYY